MANDFIKRLKYAMQRNREQLKLCKTREQREELHDEYEKLENELVCALTMPSPPPGAVTFARPASSSHSESGDFSTSTPLASSARTASSVHSESGEFSSSAPLASSARTASTMLPDLMPGIISTNHTGDTDTNIRNINYSTTLNLIVEKISGRKMHELSFSNNVASYTTDAEPVPRQRAEVAGGWSADFLNKITRVPVEDCSGAVVYLSPCGPVSSVNSSPDERRQPVGATALTERSYNCRQVNFDFALSHDRMDGFGSVPEFAESVRSSFERQRSLDVLRIGFNGTHYAQFSNIEENPNLEDCGVGWLQKIREEAPERVLSGLSVASPTGASYGDYANIDALVWDALNTAIEEQYQIDLAIVCSSETMTRRNRSFFEKAGGALMPNAETLAARKLIEEKTINQLPVVTVPGFPDDAILITPLTNLALYYHKSATRGLIRNEPEYNRLAFYTSWSLDWIVQAYEPVCLIDGIEWK
ncbi:P2 family phage major capsid protein [Escherichia coli]|uniref:P2 family phage major capsid protein n=1 Tax=Escherichia coli TaxID=562 RepID=UPI001CBD16C1|nr:P2 family phage major capsid protein [Escherichia coli]